MENKELAEFAAEFLELKGNEDFYRILKTNGKYQPGEYAFFECSRYAPQLAHHAKRKMEKLGFDYQCMEFLCGEYRFKGSRGTVIFQGAGDENEFIALWSAIKEALEE